MSKIKENLSKFIQDLPKFLQDTGIKPLVIIGKSMNYFDPQIVVSLLVGIFLLWIYYQMPFLPFHAQVFAQVFPVPIKNEMEISGTITDWKGEKLDSAQVYFVPENYKKYVDDVKIKEKLPKGNYDIVVSTPQPYQKYGLGYVDVNDPNFEIKMPPGEGKIEGRVKDTDGRDVKNKIVCISGGSLRSEVCARTDSQGKYSFESIPAFSIGSAHLTVKVEGTNELTHVEEVKAYEVNKVEDIRIKTGEDPRITGVVTDRNSKPIPNILVLVDKKYSAITTAQGGFSIDLPTRKVYLLEVMWGNRTLYSKKINVNSDPFNYNIKLP
jgi:hypothetical protein